MVEPDGVATLTPERGLHPGTRPAGRRRRGRAVARLLLVRLAVAVPLLALVSLALFLLADLSPFDPLASLLGSNYQSATQSGARRPARPTASTRAGCPSGGTGSAA
ncbi:hypothetical protein MTP03_21840 [Tsukamurella sp. PLM1]|nr:hypothetical protein MTP03_21840 [Tsukamurella sp. PLM1]